MSRYKASIITVLVAYFLHSFVMGEIFGPLSDVGNRFFFVCISMAGIALVLSWPTIKYKD